MKEKLKIGDSVQVIKREFPCLKFGEVGQIVELVGRGHYQQALVQSYNPTLGDGRWWIFTKKLKKVDVWGKRAVSVGQYVLVNNEKYLVAKIAEMRYCLIHVKSGVALKEPIDSLYLEDLKE